MFAFRARRFPNGKTDSVPSVDITQTASGKSAVWESGGGKSKTGEALIICGKSGEKLTPFCIRKSGDRSCGDHALFPIEVGSVIVRSKRQRTEYETFVYKVTEIDRRKSLAYLTRLSDEQLEYFLQFSDLGEAIEMAEKKTEIYHCRFPLFYKHRFNADSEKSLLTMQSFPV